MTLFILILNFNGKQDTLDCLKSLQSIKTKDLRLETVVIDNGSTDGSVEEIEKRYEEIKVLRNSKNLGFAAGVNVGIRYALDRGAERILLLNNDTIVPANFLKPLLTNKTDILSPIIKFKSMGEWRYDLGGQINHWTGRAYHHEVKKLEPEVKNLNPDYVSGCCLLAKREVFEKVGLLDERYFLYYEDADFCLRAKKAGFKLAVERRSIVFHKLGATIGHLSPLAIYHSLRSNFIFVSKHLGWRRPVGYLYLAALATKIIFDKSLKRSP